MSKQRSLDLIRERPERGIIFDGAPVPGAMTDPIRITAQMLDIRDQMRALFGDRYEERIAPFLDAIQRWTKESGKPVAEVALVVAKVAEKNGGGMDLGLAIAAGVEAMDAK